MSYLAMYDENTTKIAQNQKDNINPDHYKGSIECIDAIEASMTKEAFRGYCKGNILKYVWRYENKNLKEDLLKSQWYTSRLVKTYETQD
tara:strand:- start:23 stop:289 length:267 start_codon:yes stop_codon:yes gene_type:complete